MALPFSNRERKNAFARWALPHMDRVFAAGLALTRNREEAEDLLQETYLRAFRFFHQFTPGTNCRAWRARCADGSHATASARAV